METNEAKLTVLLQDPNMINQTNSIQSEVVRNNFYPYLHIGIPSLDILNNAYMTLQPISVLNQHFLEGTNRERRRGSHLSPSRVSASVV